MTTKNDVVMKGDFSGAADFPDDSSDHERFSGSAAAWVVAALLICLILGGLCLVVYIHTFIYMH